MIEESYKQLEIWVVPFTEQQSLSYQMFELKKKQDSMRKGLYKKLNDTYAEIAILKDEVELLKQRDEQKSLILSI